MAVWVLAGVLSLLGALMYGELGAMRPEAGGRYVFIRDGFGAFPAFLYGRCSSSLRVARPRHWLRRSRVISVSSSC